MSTFLGVLHRDEYKVERRLLSTLLEATANSAYVGFDAWTDRGVGLASHYTWISPEDKEQSQPIVSRDGQIVLSADLRLDNRRELAGALGLQREEARNVSDARLLLLTYERWSTRCVERLLGDFAFVLWDARRQHLFVARDPLGVRQVYYFNSHNLFIASSDIAPILAHPAVTPAINESMVAEFLAGLWHNHEESMHQNIFYCPPGHCLLASDGGFTKWRYWDIDPERRLRYRSDQEYADHYRHLLRQSVQCRMRSLGDLGISLSGGLDSTPVAALAAEMLPQIRPGQDRLQGFSYVFDELRTCDERRFIEPVARRFDLHMHYVVGDRYWPLRNLASWPLSRDPLNFDPYLSLTGALLAEAKDAACQLLLTGSFGDFLYAGSDYWAAGLLHDRRWKMLMTQLSDRQDIAWRRDVGIRGLAQFLAPPFRRRWPRTPSINGERTAWPAVSQGLARRADLELRAWDPPDYERFRRPTSWHRWNAINAAHGKKVLASARAAWNRLGLERYDVFHDRRLVEFAMAVPAYQLGLPGSENSRRVLRQAMKGILPESVRLRTDKTALSELYEEGVLRRERETIERLLADPAIVQLGYVDPRWLAAQLPLGCASRGDGFTLWRCVILELWLQRYWLS